MDAYTLMSDDRLLGIARRLADFVVEVFYYRKSVPYCLSFEQPEALAPSDVAQSDAGQADAPIIDPANGLFKLYRHTREARYFNVGLNLWFEYWLHQAHAPGRPELHGATVWGVNPLRERGVTNENALYKSTLGADHVAHNCVYYHNQFILSSEPLLEIVSEKQSLR